MAAILTMICERVVKTGAIRNFGAPQRAPRLRLARPIRGSCFRDLTHLGFCESGLSPEELRGNLAGMQFANGASFDHLDANRGQNWRHLQFRAWRPCLPGETAHEKGALSVRAPFGHDSQTNRPVAIRA